MSKHNKACESCAGALVACRHQYEVIYDLNQELLEALQEIVKCEINRREDLKTISMKPGSLYDFSNKRVIKAQAAIAKATGGQP